MTWDDKCDQLGCQANFFFVFGKTFLWRFFQFPKFDELNIFFGLQFNQLIYNFNFKSMFEEENKIILPKNFDRKIYFAGNETFLHLLSESNF